MLYICSTIICIILFIPFIYYINNNNLGDYNNTNAEISKINTDKKTNNTVNSMVNDSDLIVLQDNYTYLLWSILAVGIFTVTLRNINK